MDEQMRDHFNRSVGGYDAYTRKSYSLQRERKAWQRMYREILGSSDQTVLNIGCGPGTEAMALADAGFTVTAVDFSPKMVEAAKRNAEDNNLSILILEGDAEDLQFEDGSFDCVVSNYAMWAIPNPDKALSEFWRVLKPGGILAYADTGNRKTDHKHLRKIWVKIAVRMRDRDGNSHKGESTQEDRDRIRKLWSSGADRPAKDLQMAKDAGFRDVTIHSDLNRRVFKGTRYIEYGYTNGFLLVARK